MYRAGLPLPPDVEFNITSFSVENITVCLTWQSQKSDIYYLINSSRADMKYNMTSTEICETKEYNTPLQISVVAVNCAGKSESMTIDINIGRRNSFGDVSQSLFLSWLWSSQSTGQWQCW